MLKRFLYLLAAFLLIMVGSVSAQRESLNYFQREPEEDPYDELTFLSTGVNYLSNNVYLGRKDTAKLPYFTPFLGYQLFNGIYIKASFSYAPTHKTGHFDLLTLQAGYDRNFGKKITAGVSVDKYFYYKNSPGIRSALKQSEDIYLFFKNKVLEPQLELTLNQGKSDDFVLGASLDHNFRFRNNTLNLIPAMTLNLGSTNFYNDYFITRQKKKDRLFNQSIVVKEAGAVKPLDVELSAKTTLRKNEWLFTLTPVVTFPLSPATVIIANKQRKENLVTSYYLELDISYRHERK